MTCTRIMATLPGMFAFAFAVTVALVATVPATVTRTIDGDSLEVSAAIWPDITATSQVRVAGVDTPEMTRAECPAERALGLRARDRTAALTAHGVTLIEPRAGKYAGRVVARVMLPDGRDLAAVLIAEGLGRAYAGGRRASWCETN